MKLDETFIANVQDGDVKSLIILYKMQFEALKKQYKECLDKPYTAKNLMLLNEIEDAIYLTQRELKALGC